MMLKTVDRYVIREVVPPFLLALLIFTFILELPPITGYSVRSWSWQAWRRPPHSM